MKKTPVAVQGHLSAPTGRHSTLVTGIHKYVGAGYKVREERYKHGTCNRASPSRSTFITSSPAATTDSGCATGFAFEAPLQPNTSR